MIYAIGYLVLGNLYAAGYRFLETRYAGEKITEMQGMLEEAPEITGYIYLIALATYLGNVALWPIFFFISLGNIIAAKLLGCKIVWK